MRLGVISIFAKEKILTFLFLILMRSWVSNSGSQFRKCLGSDKVYEGIVSFANNIGNKTFCCNNDPTTSWECVTESVLDCSKRYYSGWIQGQCIRTEQSTFCVSYNPRLPLYNGGLCGGILNDVPLVNKTGCFGLEEVKKTLLNLPTTVPNFSWACCISQGCPGRAPNCTGSSYCKVPTDVEFNIGSGLVEPKGCEVGEYSSSEILMCFTDNGGWTCLGNSTYTINAFRPLNSSACTLQITTSSSETSATNTYTITETVIVNNEVIPVWGTAVVGIGSSLITIGLTALIRFCWLLAHRSPVIFIPGTGN